MGLKDKISQYYVDSYMKKYGDRLTQLQGKVLSIKIEETTKFFIYHVLKATVVIKPDYARGVSTATYRKKRWFKKPSFMDIKQGHQLIIQGLKADHSKKKDSSFKETVEVLNIRNMSNKTDLVPTDAPFETPKVQQRVKRR